MKTIKILSGILATTLSIFFSVAALAQEIAPTEKNQLAESSAGMTNGEVRKIDKDNKKITLNMEK